jgi:putative nucleotidyltransferase with HDIG domain
VAVPTDIIRQIDRLDPMPMSARRLMGALQTGNVGATEIASYIEHDPAMAAAVLHSANSAAYGGMALASLRDAVLRLGTSNILSLVLGGTMARLKARLPLYGLEEDDLWLHSVAASTAVKVLQHERPAANIPDSAAVAALLHDIGKLVMTRYMKADAGAIVSVAAERDITFVAAEHELLGCDHTEVGGALARHWGLPRGIVEAIEGHHDDPLVSPTVTMDAVMVANVTAKSISAGLGAEGMNLHADPGSFHRLGLDFTGYSRVILQTLTWVNELKAAYRPAA